MNKNNKIYIAGHRGLVGSAIVRRLQEEGYSNLVNRTHDVLDLRDARAVNTFFEEETPDLVFLAAAKVGGIMANATYPADFIRDNLQIQTNVIDAAYRNGVEKLCFLGSSCVYPKYAPQPIMEQHLLSGPLESTNQWYATAKIAGIKMCQAYRQQFGFNAITVMPTNLYGPGDNFDLEKSHVLPALIRKFHDAKKEGNDTVTLWGTGEPRREFLHVDDLASACIFLMKNYSSGQIVNVGVGEDVSIRALAELVQSIIGHQGTIEWDRSKPDGTPRKLLDTSRVRSMGWEPAINLADGISATYAWYLEHQDGLRE